MKAARGKRESRAAVEVDVTLEIRARVPDGVKDDVVRTVSENAKILNFQNFAFERE